MGFGEISCSYFPFHIFCMIFVEDRAIFIQLHSFIAVYFVFVFITLQSILSTEKEKGLCVSLNTWKANLTHSYIIELFQLEKQRADLEIEAEERAKKAREEV